MLWKLVEYWFTDNPWLIKGDFILMLHFIVLLMWLWQGSTIDLKRLYVSLYALKNLGIHHVQAKNCKKLKKHKDHKSTSKTKDKKPFDFKFF